MFSVVWDVSTEIDDIDKVVELFKINTKSWKKWDQSSSLRRHKTSGFRLPIGDCKDVMELSSCMSIFVENNSEVLKYLKNNSFTSEIDVGVIVDPRQVALVSLQLPFDIQKQLTNHKIVLVYTVMFSDESQ